MYVPKLPPHSNWFGLLFLFFQWHSSSSIALTYEQNLQAQCSESLHSTLFFDIYKNGLHETQNFLLRITYDSKFDSHSIQFFLNICSL